MTMTTGEAMDLARAALMLTLQLSGPILIVGMLVGLAISLIQSVTQLQEQTLTFVPKMIAMAVAALLFLPWLSTQIMDFTQRMFMWTSLTD